LYFILAIVLVIGGFIEEMVYKLFGRIPSATGKMRTEGTGPALLALHSQERTSLWRSSNIPMAIGTLRPLCKRAVSISKEKARI
jgi:hypothetical protein